MVSALEARSAILTEVAPVATESVPLRACFGRVPAEDIVAAEDVPAFDNSSMDGFAVSSADTKAASLEHPLDLSIIGEGSAGNLFSGSLASGAAVRVTTGTPIPEGADAVIELEAVLESDGRIAVTTPVPSGQFIRRRGEDIGRGLVAVCAGAEIRPATVGVLASIGVTDVTVFRLPRIAFLTTGTELIEPGDPLRPGAVRNSNAYTIEALIRQAGCEPAYLGTVPDDPHALRARLKDAFAYDAVITTGGASVGSYDIVKSVSAPLGVIFRFTEVNIKPGKPFAFGIRLEREHRTPIFCLPGNPVSAAVTFLQFVRPALRLMGGSSEPERTLRFRARMDHAIPKQDGKRHFVRGILLNRGGVLSVASAGSQSSGVLTSLVRANCLIILREDQTNVMGGDEVDVEMLP